MPVSVYIQKPFLQGLYPVQIGRNGVAPDAVKIARLTNYMHMLAGTRFKVLARKFIPTADIVDMLATDPALVIGRFVAHTSPNATVFRCHYTLLPSLDTSTGESPSIILTVKELDTSTQPATVAATSTQATLYAPIRKAAAAVPDDFIQVDVVLTGMSGNKTYAFEFQQIDRARVMAIMIYEQTHEGKLLDPAGAGVAAINMSAFVPGGPVYDRDIADLFGTMGTIKNRQGSQLIGHAHYANADPGINTSSASYANILDTTFTTVSANSPGFQTWQAQRGFLGSAISPCAYYAFGYITSALASGSVIFLNSASATVANISAIGSTSGYYTALTSSLGTGADTKIDIQFKVAAATNNLTVKAFGMFEYQG